MPARDGGGRRGRTTREQHPGMAASVAALFAHSIGSACAGAPGSPRPCAAGLARSRGSPTPTCLSGDAAMTRPWTNKWTAGSSAGTTRTLRVGRARRRARRRRRRRRRRCQPRHSPRDRCRPASRSRLHPSRRSEIRCRAACRDRTLATSSMSGATSARLRGRVCVVGGSVGVGAHSLPGEGRRGEGLYRQQATTDGGRMSENEPWAGRTLSRTDRLSSEVRASSTEGDVGHMALRVGSVLGLGRIGSQMGRTIGFIGSLGAWFVTDTTLRMKPTFCDLRSNIVRDVSSAALR